MSSEEIEEESKEEKFKRIAIPRTRRILKDIQLLGNCANTRNYSYTEKDLNEIFPVIEAELQYVKSLFETRN